MAQQTNIEFRVGLIIILAGVVLAISMYWLQGYRLERNSQLIQVEFSDVGSLAVGDKVTVSGVSRGKVKAFDLTDNGVLVEILLARDVHLRSDAKFLIQNIGVMGDRFVAISPGQASQPFDTTAVARGHSDTGMPDLMGLLGETVTELRDLVSSIRKNVQTESTFEKFNSTLTNFNRVAKTLADYLDRNEARFDQTAENLQSTSNRLASVIEKNETAIDSTISRIDQASLGLTVVLANLDSMALSVRTFTDNLESQDGTVQALLEDRRLYDELRQTLDNFDELVEDIRANPSKYIDLKIELF